MALSFGRLARRWSGALMALLGLSLLAPAVAKAGCDSRVGHAGMVAAHFDLLGNLGALDEPGAMPDRGPSPCANGACSRGKSSPLAPSATDVSVSSHWAMLADPLPPPTPLDGRLRSLDEDDRRPIDLGPAIFHPPRHG